jgi:hypothetical protein
MTVGAGVVVGFKAKDMKYLKKFHKNSIIYIYLNYLKK